MHVLAAAGQSTYIKLRKPVVTPYRAGFATLASDGALATTPNVQIIGVPSLSSNGTVKLPILQPVTAKFASLAPIAPFTRPNRNSDGNVIDDIDTTYMTDYKLRLLKIANSKANLHIINISFYRGGITEDVDFDIDLVSQATNAEPISGGAVATIGTKVELIENDLGATNQRSAILTKEKFCPKRKGSANKPMDGKGKRNGGAIFFSGESFICEGCHFVENHVSIPS